MIELTDAQRMLQSTVRDFAGAEIDPIADDVDREDRFPLHLWPMLGELGLLGVTIPERYGGSDAGLLAGVIATEEIARASASIALSFGAHANLCANNIAANGSEAQKEEYLPSLCDGSAIGALALTEPEGWIGCDGDSHDGRARRRCLPAERQQNVHHQWIGRRHAGALCQD